MGDGQQITVLLRRISSGDAGAEEELFTAVHGELRMLAGCFLRRERPGHTLQPTALVNEAYLRMLGSMGRDWTDHAHFFRVAARVMRRILVDYARQRTAAKRSALAPPEIEAGMAISEEKLTAVLAVDRALRRLEKQDPRQAKIVEMRFFGGLTEEEISLILGTSARTVKRDWTAAKAWLKAEL